MKCTWTLFVLGWGANRAKVAARHCVWSEKGPRTHLGCGALRRGWGGGREGWMGREAVWPKYGVGARDQVASWAVGFWLAASMSESCLGSIGQRHGVSDSHPVNSHTCLVLHYFIMTCFQVRVPYAAEQLPCCDLIINNTSTNAAALTVFKPKHKIGFC